MVENSNSPASGIYGNSYHIAKDSVGLTMTNLDSTQYITGAAVIDNLAKAMQDLKSQLEQKQK